MDSRPAPFKHIWFKVLWFKGFGFSRSTFGIAGIIAIYSRGSNTD